jgi:group I intron endonuclease
MNHLPRSSGVYRIVFKPTGKEYIGSTQVSILGRCKKHRTSLNGGYHKNPILQAFWNKHGGGAFLFECLETCPPSEAASREQYFMDWSKDKFNVMPSAESRVGFRHSEETKTKISNSRDYTSEGYRAKMSQAKRKNWIEGMYDRELHRINMRKVLSDPAIQAKRLATLRSENTRAKIRESRKASMSTESIIDWMKKIGVKEKVLISPSGEEVTVFYLKEFCLKMGLKYNAMVGVCNSKQTQHQGWKIKK